MSARWRQGSAPAPGETQEFVSMAVVGQTLAGVVEPDEAGDRSPAADDDRGQHVLAARLRLSPASVRNHVQNILEKLRVHSRLEAVAWMTRASRSRLDEA